MLDHHLYSLVYSHLPSYIINIVDSTIITTDITLDGMGMIHTGNAYSATVTQATTLAIAF
jgi:hypothetical protein